MEQCTVYCINTETDAIADILQKNDKRIRVAFIETDITVDLYRQDVRMPYVGSIDLPNTKLEFETFGVIEE